MQDDPRETIGEVFYDVMEKLAFMFGEMVPNEELLTSYSESYITSMGFSGDLEGSLSLVAPIPMCEEIAANMLGIEPDDKMAAEHACDALKEVLSVTCGHLLTAFAGPTPTFNLSMPEIEKLEEVAWEEMLHDPDTVAFLVDSNTMLLRLKLKSVE